MAKIEYGDDFDVYLKKLQSLEKGQMIEFEKVTVYEGAGEVADAIRKEIESIPESKNARQGPTRVDKKDLLQGFGISPMNIYGDVSVKIGFAGYGHKTDKYPQGVPIPMIARAILGGNSFRPSNDFMDRAVRKSKKKCLTKMNDTLRRQLEKEFRNG